MLDELFAGALADAAFRQEQVPLAALEEQILSAPPARDAIAELRPSRFVTLIAEIKRASPSRGQMAEIADPVRLAREYQTGGAAAISILTESRKFLGSLQDLRDVRGAIDLPLLRKDFIATEYQVLEARANGADFVLLIATWLPAQRLVDLLRFCSSLGMACLVETHSEAEIESAIAAEAKLIGINTRDLTTFQTDIGLFERLAKRIPADCVKVAESSVRTRSDIERYRDAGADSVLVGEALVTGDTATLLSEFTTVTV